MKILSLTLTLLLLATAIVPAEPRERVAPRKPAKTKPTGHAHHGMIVVKFQEGTRVRQRLGRLQAEAHKRSQADLRKLGNLDDLTIDTQVEAANELVRTHPKARLERLFSRAELDLDNDRKKGEQDADEELADLNLYYRIVIDDADPSESEQLLDDLNSLDVVEIAYAEPIAEEAAIDLAPTTANLTGNQDYLDAAPAGVDALYAWGFGGGRGEQVRVIDIERDWTLNHEDLNGTFHSSGFFDGTSSSRNHGTAVLGVVGASENNYGITGIAPGSSLGVSSVRRVNAFGTIVTDLADAINRASAAMGPGDIIIIEQHAQGPASGVACVCNCAQFEFIAMEFFQANYDAIRNATAAGIIVVEAAGNGSMNLDAAIYEGRFNRTVRDSGAILVGAGSAGGREPTCWSNHGSRLDVQGWGEAVATLAFGDLLKANGNDERQWYTGQFSGTSSASPIVAGAAAAVQGLRKARGMTTLNSKQMRSLLGQSGTPQAADSRRIGPLPDLRNAFLAHGVELGTLTPSTRVRSVSGVVAPGGGRHYKFTAQAGGRFGFTTCDGANFDTVLEIRNSRGTLVASNDNECFKQSLVAFQAPSSGTYYVSVRGANSLSAGPFTMQYGSL